MIARFCSPCFLLLFGVSLFVQGQTYDIKIKVRGDEGKVLTSHDTSSDSFHLKLTLGNQVLKEENKKSEKDIVYQETVLKSGTKRALEYQRVYEKAMESEGGKKKPLSYQGKTILYELIDGEYAVKTKDSTDLLDKDRKKLQDNPNNPFNQNWPELLVPKTKLEVGETWKLDPKTIAEGISKELPVDPAKSEASGKFVKAYKKGKQQWGSFLFEFKLAIPSFGGLQLDTPINFKMNTKLDVAIDGSSAAGQMEGSAMLQGTSTLNQGGQQFTLEIDSRLTSKGVQSAEK